MKKIVLGILAHVDAGKTTLSEGLLYLGGVLRRLGRVDRGDAFFDTHDLERKRGITIFSKQAQLQWGELEATLLDTPGHVDFSAEMERTLQVLDYAILVVSGTEGVQAHTETLWRLLKKYQIPVFLFVNKMDLIGADRDRVLGELQRRLDSGCLDFGQGDSVEFYEGLAMCDEGVLEQYLERGLVEREEIARLIRQRLVFPCFFGSALRLEGVREFLEGLSTYVLTPDWPEDFGARVFKILRDSQGARLTYLKVTGGALRVKDEIAGEKVNQIRVYSGEKFQAVNEAPAGTVCAVAGPNLTRAGQGIGLEGKIRTPILEPVLSCKIQLPKGCDAPAMLPKLRQLEEEAPELRIAWNETLQEIQAQVMGEVQIEILRSLIAERFGVAVEFGDSSIVYKETITSAVEGVGHFEPLRHYAEVHLLLEPGEPGSGMQFFTECGEDHLDRNWQRLILSHLYEKEHIGVLTGSALTDMKITLVAGRAHNKHTEGGDFRQATWRAVRQGLMEAESLLLEPWYDFLLEVPGDMVGRAMTDIERMGGTCTLSQTPEDEGDTSDRMANLPGNRHLPGGWSQEAGRASDRMAILEGSAPVAAMGNYQREVIAYSKGRGRLFCSLKGYAPCRSQEEVIAAIGYQPLGDLDNPSSSVFCIHGTGTLVEWDQVKAHMHLESCLAQAAFCRKHNIPLKPAKQEEPGQEQAKDSGEKWIGTEEIDRILERTYHANKKGKSPGAKGGFRRTKEPERRVATPPDAPPKTGKLPKEPKEEYLLVDGYNMLFAWEELKSLAEVDIEGARGRLLDILCNYQGLRQCRVMAVFDAYRFQGHRTELIPYHNISVVFTKEAETADQFIEKFAHENAAKYAMTVATSDRLEQIIILGAGCARMSAAELEAEVAQQARQIQEEYRARQPVRKNYLVHEALEKLSKETDEGAETGGKEANRDEPE